MSVEVEAVTGCAAELGEGPHWDHRAQALYFIGVVDQTMHKYVPATGEHTKTKAGGHLNMIIPVEGHLNHFVINHKREIVVVEWDGAEGSEVRVVKRLAEVDAHEPDNTLNDGKVDPLGRLYSGTFPPSTDITDAHTFMAGVPRGKGAIYRLDKRGVSRVWDNISMANGLGFDEARGALYYIDSVERAIRKYDHNVITGDVSNLQYIFDFEKQGVAGYPDGMTMDAEGNLWIAALNDEAPGSVIQVSPEGKLLRQVTIPVWGVTSCTFGGPDLDVLYVTTGFLAFGKPQARVPLDGCMFKVTGLGVKGQLNRSFKL